MVKGPNSLQPLLQVIADFRTLPHIVTWDYGKAYSGDYIFKIAFNHIHDFGGAILSDFGAIYIGAGYNCPGANKEQLEQHCYSHAHIYNNWIEDGTAYNVGVG